MKRRGEPANVAPTTHTFDVAGLAPDRSAATPCVAARCSAAVFGEDLRTIGRRAEVAELGGNLGVELVVEAHRSGRCNGGRTAAGRSAIAAGTAIAAAVSPTTGATVVASATTAVAVTRTAILTGTTVLAGSRLGHGLIGP